MSNPSLKSIKSRPTLTGAAFQSIKQAIIGGRLEAGRIYSEQALAKDMGISKTPVHNALIDLANKGFLTILPQRGFRVGKLTSRDVRDLFVFRSPLEEMVVIQVTPLLGEQGKAEIDRLLKNLSDSLDWLTFLKYDRRFHRYLAGLTGNQFIINALANIWDLCDWIGARNLAYDGDFTLGLEEHLVVGRRLLAGEPKEAAQAMRAHLKSTETRFLEQMMD